MNIQELNSIIDLYAAGQLTEQQAKQIAMASTATPMNTRDTMMQLEQVMAPKPTAMASDTYAKPSPAPEQQFEFGDVTQAAPEQDPSLVQDFTGSIYETLKNSGESPLQMAQRLIYGDSIPMFGRQEPNAPNPMKGENLSPDMRGIHGYEGPEPIRQMMLDGAQKETNPLSRGIMSALSHAAPVMAPVMRAANEIDYQVQPRLNLIKAKGERRKQEAEVRKLKRADSIMSGFGMSKTYTGKELEKRGERGK